VEKRNQPPVQPQAVATGNLEGDPKRTRDALYYQNNKARIIARARRYAKDHQDRVNELARLRHEKGYRRDPVKLAEWIKKNRPKINARAQRYRSKHLLQCRDRAATWKKLHPERVKIHAHKKRIQRLNAPTSPDAVSSIKIIQNLRVGKCFYCGKRRRLTIEHIIPLTKGGHHSAANITGACWKCNHDKLAQHPNVFIKHGQFVLL